MNMRFSIYLIWITKNHFQEVLLHTRFIKRPKNSYEGAWGHKWKTKKAFNRSKNEILLSKQVIRSNCYVMNFFHLLLKILTLFSDFFKFYKFLQKGTVNFFDPDRFGPSNTCPKLGHKSLCWYILLSLITSQIW